jgi:enoyl-[acyl-carrier protein] reductase I
MGLLDGKRLLVTGVITDDSIAFGVAKKALEEGAEIVLTGFGRGLSLTQRTARKLPSEVDVLALDVTDSEHGQTVQNELASRWGKLDGILHAVAFAPGSCLGGDFLLPPWEDVAIAMQVSTYSFASLTHSMLPLLEANGGGSVIGLDFDAQVAWPMYNWMGVAKAGLESCSRYLARELGPKNVRVNLVAAGPIRTLAGKSIPGFDKFEDVWAERAPIGWDLRDTEPVARACVALFSDFFPSTTGEIIHVDGGFHAIGA